MTLGGRAAEDIIFSEVSTGAQNDLERITKSAYSIVTLYGMNEKVGQVSFRDDNEYSFGKPYSEATAQTIDQEVRKIIQSAYERTKALLKERRKELELIAQELLKKEVLFKDDLVRLIGKRPFGMQDEAPEEETPAPANGAVHEENGAEVAVNGVESKEVEETSSPDPEAEPSDPK